MIAQTRSRTKLQLFPKLIGLDNHVAIINWLTYRVNKSVEIVSRKTGQLIHVLPLEREFSVITRAQICNGRIAVSGSEYETEKREIIIMDIKRKEILLKCSKLFNLRGVLHFSFHKDKIIFLEDEIHSKERRKAIILCSKVWW